MKNKIVMNLQKFAASKTGVYPCYENQFQVDTASGGTASLKNIEEFELNNNIISNRVDFDSWIDSSYLEKAVQEYQGSAQ